MKSFLQKLKNGVNSILLYNVLPHWQWLYLLFPNLRASILRFAGAKVGKNLFVGFGMYCDNNAKMLSIGDNVLIAPKVTLLFHRRDLSNYKHGQLQRNLIHIKLYTIIENNVSIGIGATIMPGVRLGEGAVVAAGALVTKDVEPWTLVAGVPAKVIKKYTPMDNEI